MTSRRTATKLLGGLALTAGLGLPRRARSAQVLKIGTVVPATSPWGEVFKSWAEAVALKSGGDLELQLFFSGQQGDDAAMVGKMRAGLLDGAALSAAGLSALFRPFMVLQIPGVFTSWPVLDGWRLPRRGYFEQGAARAGFTIVGFCDFGEVHALSKGFAVRVPLDLKRGRPFMWRDDDAQKLYFRMIGVAAPVPLNVPEVLPSLVAGAVNVVFASSLVAEQLQWSRRLDMIHTRVSSLATGALVLSAKRLSSLPPDHRELLLETGHGAVTTLIRRVRVEDGEAFARMTSRMTVITPTADEKKQWDALDEASRLRIGDLLPPEVISGLPVKER